MKILEILNRFFLQKTVLFTVFKVERISVGSRFEPDNVRGEALSENDSCISVKIKLSDVPKPVDHQPGPEPVDVGPELVPQVASMCLRVPKQGLALNPVDDEPVNSYRNIKFDIQENFTPSHLLGTLSTASI